MVCDGFEGRFYAWVSREWGERAACGGEPVGVEGSIFVGFEVEEVCAADGECAGGCGELDHLLGRVGGVCDGDAGGVAVFVGNVVAFLEVAEPRPFPCAAVLVGDVLVVAGAAPACGARACGVVVRVRGHLCSSCSSFPFLTCSPPGPVLSVFSCSPVGVSAHCVRPGARFFLSVNSSRAGAVGAGARVYSFSCGFARMRRAGSPRCVGASRSPRVCSRVGLCFF